MRIRLLKKKDIAEVSKLLVDSYKKEDKKRRWNLKYANEYILLIYRMCKDLCFVATENEKIIAVALCIIQPEFDKNILESKVLLVHPEYRKRKIASKLLKKICIKANNKYNIDIIQTNIYTFTNFPITWYESIGFRTRKNYETTRANIDKVLKVI